MQMTMAVALGDTKVTRVGLGDTKVTTMVAVALGDTNMTIAVTMAPGDTKDKFLENLISPSGRKLRSQGDTDKARGRGLSDAPGPQKRKAETRRACALQPEASLSGFTKADPSGHAPLGRGSRARPSGRGGARLPPLPQLLLAFGSGVRAEGDLCVCRGAAAARVRACAGVACVSTRVRVQGPPRAARDALLLPLVLIMETKRVEIPGSVLDDLCSQFILHIPSEEKDNAIRVLLVQGYLAKSGWGFPKGKVNKEEAPCDCAAREVIVSGLCSSSTILFLDTDGILHRR
ncbi:uncharacterized protein LOC141498797 [Macrotis lagotis]|uniref:uncharacterized protein LOC141498797 n=1 Tax=Macrotis lagotis TaxID=92651 RepID=UPI003D692126